MSQYSSNRLTRNEQMRQNLEQGVIQSLEPHERPSNAEIAK